MPTRQRPSPSPTASADDTIARSSSVTLVGLGTLAPAPEDDDEGRRCTDRRRRRQRPDEHVDAVGGRDEQDVGGERRLDLGEDLVVAEAPFVDERADLVAQVDRGPVARLEHALAVAHRAGDAPGEGVGTFAGVARSVVAADADGEQHGGDDSEEQPSRPVLDGPVEGRPPAITPPGR